MGTLADKFPQVQAKSVTDTLTTLLDVELKTLGNTLANKITQAPFYAVAERLAEVEAETLGDNTGRCESRGTTSCSG